jgi:hypothetical protein
VATRGAVVVQLKIRVNKLRGVNQSAKAMSIYTHKLLPDTWNAQFNLLRRYRATAARYPSKHYPFDRKTPQGKQTGVLLQRAYCETPKSKLRLAHKRRSTTLLRRGLSPSVQNPSRLLPTLISTSVNLLQQRINYKNTLKVSNVILRNYFNRRLQEACTLEAAQTVKTFLTRYKVTKMPYSDELNAGRIAAAELNTQQQQRNEQFFYKTRQTMRLPAMTVGRTQRRKAGHNLFTRHTLKHPKTLLGIKNMLLPRNIVYSRVSAARLFGTDMSTQALCTRKKRENTHARVWMRPPTRANLKNIAPIVLRQRRVNIRRGWKKLRFHEQQRRREIYARKRFLSTASGTEHTGIKLITSPSKHASIQLCTAVGTYKGTRKVENKFLRRAAVNTSLTRRKNLWHAKSVQEMRRIERGFSAWAPQIPVRLRRWSSPRVSGVPMFRTWSSFKTLRSRRQLNENLAFRGFPQKRYIDFGYAHLKFHRGSAASVGYTRLRRVYRGGKSEYARWWRPVKYGVPFAHPYSRRSLSCKKYRNQQFAVASLPERGELHTTVNQPVTAKSVTRRRRAHVIPWRNFNYRAPGFGPVPRTLQRWTQQSKIRPFRRVAKKAKANILTTRHLREIHVLEKTFFHKNVWSGHQWEVIDKKEAPSMLSRQLIALTRLLPGTIWGAIQKKIGSPALYASVQASIFAEFNRWGRKNLRVNLPGELLTKTQEAKALKYLVGLLKLVLSSNTAIHAFSLNEKSASQATALRSEAFNRKAAWKREQFWQLSELPKRQYTKTNMPVAPLARGNSLLYKCWLQGASRFLHRSQVGYTPTAYGRYLKISAESFGRRRLRFPGAGRGPVFESVLHAFARRTSPSSYRRASTLKFKRVTAEAISDFREKLIVNMLGCRLRRQRLHARKLISNAYLSSSWRELLTYRAATWTTGTVVGGNQVRGCTVLASKRRFAVLPTNTVFNYDQKNIRSIAPSTCERLHTLRYGALRRALRRRRDERPFTDLRKSSQQRRLPKDQRPLPWKAKRAVARRYKSRNGAWSYKALDTRADTYASWTFDQIASSATPATNLTPAIIKTSISGEALKLVLVQLKREPRIRQDFSVIPKIRLKGLKRRVDGRRRKRFRGRARPIITSALADFREFRHWSERRNFGRNSIDGTTGRRLFLSTRFKRAKYIAKLLSQTICMKKEQYQRVVQLAQYQQQNEFKLPAVSKQDVSKLTLESLVTFTSKNRPRYRRRLIYNIKQQSCRKTSTGDRLRRISNYVKKSSKRIIKVKGYYGKRFVAEASVLPTICPLIFQKPTTCIVMSEVAKQKLVTANIASKEIRYKFTAQYMRSLTTFIPDLINQILTKAIITKQLKVNYKTAKHIIRNIYWSLRIYLNVDPFDTRFILRDKTQSARVALLDALATLSENQVTEQPQRAALRYCFQPSRLHKAPNTARFREDWLRAFFPAQHALFQEDPEDYGLFLLSTKNVRRLRIGASGIASWRTAHAAASLETRARRLLLLRSGRTPRFETVLQSTRRVATTEVTPLIYMADIKKTSFFARAFSTQARRITFAVSRRLQQQYRLIPAEDLVLDEPTKIDETNEDEEVVDSTSSTFDAISTRYRVLPRIEARGRTNFTLEGKRAMIGGFLDLRFSRWKSPRSRQYLTRIQTEGLQRMKQVQIGNLLTLNKLTKQRSAVKSFGWTRWDRRYVSETRTIGKVQLKLHSRVQLAVTHKRALTSLKWHKSLVRNTVYKKALARCELSTLPMRFLHHQQLTSCTTEKETLHALTAQQINKIRREVPQNQRIVTTPCNVLQNRSAEQRTRVVVYKIRPTLHRNAITQDARTSSYFRRRRWWLAKIIPTYTKFFKRESRQKRAQRKEQNREFQKKIAETARQLRADMKLVPPISKEWPRKRLQAQGLMETAKTAIKEIGPKLPIKRHHQQFRRGVLRVGQKLSKIPRITTRHVVPGRALQLSQASIGASNTVSTAIVTGTIRGPRFLSNSGATYTEISRIGKRIHELARSRQETPFEEYRPKLWDRLSLRWMKRERTGRYWLKDTSRWLRDPWLSEIVSLRKHSSSHGAREQQVGEYVAEVDADGKDILEKESPFREREALVIKKSMRKPIGRVGNSPLGKLLRRKPIPAMWLAEHEYRATLREAQAEMKKSRKEIIAEEAARIKEWNLREKEGRPHEKPRRLPLKHPSNSWLPHSRWKEIQRRIRKFEWRESDEVFFRQGFRNAFSFFPSERSRAPWLEALMYTRATYSTRLREFRRRQFPREQKKYKWLQRVRKALFATQTNRYVRGRRWPQLRTYNQKLHYSLFSLPNRGAARRHFQKLAGRSRPSISSFIEAQRGLGDRTDVTLLHLNIVPSIFWARIVAPFGLLRVNSKLITDPAHRLAPGDIIQPEWDRIVRFQHFFKSALKRRDVLQKRPYELTSAYPANFEFYRGVRAMFYKHAPDESELRVSNRLQADLFRWFRLDSV